MPIHHHRLIRQAAGARIRHCRLLPPPLNAAFSRIAVRYADIRRAAASADAVVITPPDARHAAAAFARRHPTTNTGVA